MYLKFCLPANEVKCLTCVARIISCATSAQWFKCLNAHYIWPIIGRTLTNSALSRGCKSTWSRKTLVWVTLGSVSTITFALQYYCGSEGYTNTALLLTEENDLVFYSHTTLWYRSTLKIRFRPSTSLMYNQAGNLAFLFIYSGRDLHNPGTHSLTELDLQSTDRDLLFVS